jgi:N-acetylmuramoyl-L-alanine amidase
VSLDERAKYANSKLQNFRDSIFVSLHCNSSPKQTETSNGFEIYYLAQTLPVETAREISIVSHGLTDKTKNESVQKIQSGMLSSVIQRRSVVLARSIAEKLTVALDKKLSNRGVKKNNYHVLRSSLMPD